MNIDEFQVIVHISEKGKMLARVELSYKYLKILGYRVLLSEFDDGLFVQPPSIRTQKGNYLWIAKVEEPNLWKQVEMKIKSEYKLAKEKHNEETKDLDSSNNSVNPEDIPF